MDHVAEKHVHSVPTEGLYQHGNSVQIMVHRHGRFRKGLYHVVMNSNVLHFCDMQASCAFCLSRNLADKLNSDGFLILYHPALPSLREILMGK